MRGTVCECGKDKGRVRVEESVQGKKEREQREVERQVAKSDEGKRRLERTKKRWTEKTTTLR